ncbi:isoprenylcysteine carboxylmethyltransferase family protein [Stenotrophomonas indicatrix]|uniref:methyltransferase family protein n=1 Tax=Stenotrophomonas indicatrix TaxID=2045451 RepID=UPI00300888ED
MRLLETRVPPPLVMLLCGLLGLGLSRWLPAAELPTPWWAAVAVMAAGLVMNLLPKLAFQRAGTTVNPMRPASSTALITRGVYRYTRNPMYLGQAAFLLGGMLYLQNLPALAVVPMFVLYITRFQIHPEERVLGERFGAQYKAFRQQVRRWL